MTSDEAHAQAVQWAEAWNQRDIEQVLDHFHDDVEFTSPTAAAVMGVPTMKGKAALREYGQSRRVSENLRFNDLDQVVAAEVFHGIAW